MSRALQWLSLGAVVYVFYVGSGGVVHMPDPKVVQNHIERSIEKMANTIPNMPSPPQTMAAATAAVSPATKRGGGGSGRGMFILGLGIVMVGVGEYVAEKYGHGVVIDGREILESFGLVEKRKRRARGGKRSAGGKVEDEDVEEILTPTGSEGDNPWVHDR